MFGTYRDTGGQLSHACLTGVTHVFVGCPLCVCRESIGCPLGVSWVSVGCLTPVNPCLAWLTVVEWTQVPRRGPGGEAVASTAPSGCIVPNQED